MNETAQSVPLSPCFIQPRLSVHGIVLLTLMVGLSFSVQALETLTQTH